MGSTSTEAYTREQPVTQVKISRGFYLEKNQMTQLEWQPVMGTNLSKSSGCRRSPME